MAIRKLTTALACLAVLLVPLQGACAKEGLDVPDLPASHAGISEQEVQQRVTFLEAEATDNAPYSRTWWYGWTTIFGVAMVGHAAWVGLINDPNDINTSPSGKPRELSNKQIDLIVGLGTTVLGFGNMLVFPYPAHFMEKRLKAMPEDTHEQRVAKLLQAEEWMHTAAETDVRGKKWFNYLLTVGVTSLSGGLVYGFTRDWSMAGPRMAMGATVGIIKILSQSRQSLRSWQRYRHLWGGGLSEAGLPLNYDGLEMTPPPIRTGFVVSPVKGGMALGYSF